MTVPGGTSEPRRRSGNRPVASPHLAGLDLPALRAYREQLRTEEERVSYWRRLVHARLDLIGAGMTGDVLLDVDTLVRVLRDTAAGGARTAMLRVRAAEPLPDLPDLVEVWSVPHDEVSAAGNGRRLREAEEQLTAYRSELHRRIDEATEELMARYRADPRQALSLLRP